MILTWWASGQRDILGFIARYYAPSTLRYLKIARETKKIPTEKKQRSLETTSYDYTVDYLISLIEEGKIILPSQKTPLWKTEKASKLLESLLMNFPISLFYLIEQEDDKWLVVDGKQRLFAIFNFHQNKYELTKLEILKEFEKKKFKDLPPQAKRLINLSVMHIVLIRRNSQPDIVSNMMKRLTNVLPS